MFEQAFKNIDDILRKEAGCTTELDYTEQTSWLLFLKYLDALEEEKAMEAQLEGKSYDYILTDEYKWDTWAAPKDFEGKIDYNQAKTGDDLRMFVDEKLFPHFEGFKQRATSPNTIEYKIGQIFSEIRNKFQSGYNLREVIDTIDELRFRSQTEKHELSQLYEEKIKRMGNAGRNGGEYYTPRPLIRAIVNVIKPKVGDRIYDGAVGSAGFLCEAYEYITTQSLLTTSDYKTLQENTFFGKEKKSLAYVIGIMNMILHGIEAPNIVHTNTLTENIADIQEKDRFEIVLANPPFGGKERKEVQQNFPIRTGETAFLFLQHFVKILKAGGRAGIVIKNTFLSNVDNASVSLRKLLLENCNLHTILDCPSGTFQGAGVKTVVLFFVKGSPTKNIWYYELNPGRNLGKTNPLNDQDLEEFIRLQRSFVSTDKSWNIDVANINQETFDLSVKNPSNKADAIYREPKEILDEISMLDEEGKEVLGINSEVNMNESWELKTLGELCSFENGDRGKNYPSKSIQTSSGVPFINAGHLTDEGLDLENMNYIPRERFDLLKKGKIRQYDILFCLRGSLGKFASVGELKEGAIASSLVIVRPNEFLLHEFLLAYLKSDLCFNFINKFSNGAAQPNLSAKSLKNFVIPLPPLSEQLRIITILDDAFENISIAKANAQRKIYALDELQKSFLHQAFNGKL